MGMTLSELASLDVPTFVDICAEWTGKAPDDAAKPDAAKTPRMATQADIDRFLL